jgi:3-mercaptopyruvate sulfurtransferase SseA
VNEHDVYKFHEGGVMSEKIIKKSRLLTAGLLGMAMIAALTLWGCGSAGTNGYTDVAAQQAVLAAVTTTKAPAIIDAATLKQWTAEGKLNAPFGSADRVVVLSQSTFANWTTTTKGHIPGAVRLDPADTQQSRIEGLGLAANMMPDGPMMDGIIQRLGIDANTTIVFSLPKNSSIYDQSVPFWNFRYWGFARDRLKILNGGDDAWDVAGLPLIREKTDKYAASTYSVSKNAALKDIVRYSISEMIAKVDAMLADPTLKDTWQMIDVRGFTTTPYLTNALRLSSATMFMTRLNGDATKNYIYPDKATLEAKMADITNYPVRDGATNVTVSPTKKTICMCGSSISASPTFVMFDAVLNVPEGNIAMYDGSSSQWNNYNTSRLLAGFPNTVATAAQRNAWTFNLYTSPVNPLALTKNRAQGAFTSAMTSAIAGIWAYIAPVLTPSAPDMNQIENVDKAYIKPAATTTTTPPPTTGGGVTTGGGC